MPSYHEKVAHDVVCAIDAGKGAYAEAPIAVLVVANEAGVSAFDTQVHQNLLKERVGFEGLLMESNGENTKLHDVSMESTRRTVFHKPRAVNCQKPNGKGKRITAITMTTFYLRFTPFMNTALSAKLLLPIAQLRASNEPITL